MKELFTLVCAVGILAAQTPAPAPQKFEVASIKPGDPNSHQVRFMIAPGGRFECSNVTLKLLIQQAYGVRDFQIVGAPGWVSSERFNVSAKAEDGAKTDKEHLQAMLQSLLEDRFHLTIHRETKELPVYALVVGKNGPKFHEAAPPTGAPDTEGPATDGKSAPPRTPKGMMRFGRGEITAQSMDLGAFANQLAQALGRPVIDKTGLTGRYDFDLHWTPDESQSVGMGPAGPDSPPPSSDATGPSIFTALQEQLGLKVESSKGPVEIIVIERVERPTEN